MTLREKIENHLGIFFLGTLAAGFFAGVGAYDQVLRIAHLEVISQSKLEELRDDCGHKEPDHSGPVNPLIQLDTDIAASEKPNVAPREFHISDQFPPFPEHLDLIRPGMKLSEAKAVFPNGYLYSTYYIVNFDSGLFRNVSFFLDSGGEDPEVKYLAFYYRGENERRAVLAETLKKFGDIGHKSEFLGTKLEWPALNGFRLAIDSDSYLIERQSKN